MVRTREELAAMRADYKRMSPEEKVLLAFALNEERRERARAHLRARFPAWSSEEIESAVRTIYMRRNARHPT